MSERFSDPHGTEGVPVLYSNMMKTIPSPFDFALEFGYMSPVDEGSSAAPTGQVRVVMTWEYAKVLRDAMQEAIETREGNVGEIGRPPGVIEVVPAPRGKAKKG